ncbi:unnamed protein product [Dibothriocephalus latus]|uniref:Uncharacterized protein n=1 Tax=Dibothriocephalus latus TaxID=60516 RepID=A0A3P6T7G3_DIBLA|nr:unnamed protein product [Dibothriocephalus latus]
MKDTIAQRTSKERTTYARNHVKYSEETQVVLVYQQLANSTTLLSSQIDDGPANKFLDRLRHKNVVSLEER